MLATEYEKGKVYHGFKLLDKRFVKEVNAECYFFEHEKSGAQAIKIAADDANKTFGIAFKTVPESDAGTPHIMEHCVLNGSKKFPVKSPFDILTRNSLNTFINAFTGSDMTAYPVASMNEKDYFNLMDVYLDAVFNPLIYSDPRILDQEGWHYELTDPESPVVYKGVVYNEMKGAFSSPTRELGYHVDKNLFPDNGYSYSSGGYPPAIPTLTREAFLNFHKKYYHPSNSHIILYGDADLNKELAFIDSEYLSNYENDNIDITIPLQKPFEHVKELTEYYSAAEGSDTKDQTYLAMSWVTGLNTDPKLTFALQVLQQVLVTQESAPIRIALQEAGIGREVSASLDDIHQMVFQIRVQNANPEQKAKFRDVIMNTLKEVVKNGIDKKVVEGTLNRIEFNLREGDDAQKGITYGFQTINSWFFADDPFLSLEYEKPLAEIKEGINSGYLETVIKKYLIDNTHALLLDLQPKPGLAQEQAAVAEKELENYKKNLSKEEIEKLVESTNKLIEYQKSEDTPEALATIPQLSKEDIAPEASWFEVKEETVDGTKLLNYEAFTNNVVYSSIMYDASVLPFELLPYTSILNAILTRMDTENYSYSNLNVELNIHTGGLYRGLNEYQLHSNDAELQTIYEVSSKSLNTKTDKMFELMDEVINKTKFTDKERLKAILVRHQSQREADLKGNGFQYAIRRMESYYSPRGAVVEKTAGLEYYRFITELLENYDTKADEIIQNIQKVAGLIFNKKNIIAASVTCSESDLPAFQKDLKTFLSLQPEKDLAKNEWKYDFANKNEGLQSASKVQYVVQGYDFKKLGYEWTGKMRVMDKIIGRDWLYNQIRVIGGAYGGSSMLSYTGRSLLYSYRDPNLKSTLDNFKGTVEYLKNFEADDKEMTGFILSTIGDLDAPLTASEKGNTAVRRYIQGYTKEMKQKERDEILSVTAEDIRNLAAFLKDILEKSTYCVYGNEQTIEENKDLFNKLVPIVK